MPWAKEAPLPAHFFPPLPGGRSSLHWAPLEAGYSRSPRKAGGGGEWTLGRSRPARPTSQGCCARPRKPREPGRALPRSAAPFHSPTRPGPGGSRTKRLRSPPDGALAAGPSPLPPPRCPLPSQPSPSAADMLPAGPGLASPRVPSTADRRSPPQPPQGTATSGVSPRGPISVALTPRQPIRGTLVARLREKGRMTIESSRSQRPPGGTT